MELFRFSLLIVNIDASDGILEWSWKFLKILALFLFFCSCFFLTVDIFSLAAYDLGWDHHIKWQFDSSVICYPLTVIAIDSWHYYYHYSNKQAPFIVMANGRINNTIFSIILQILKNHNPADVYSIHKQIIKTVDFENITKEVLADRIHTFITAGKIINKVNRNAD